MLQKMIFQFIFVVFYFMLKEVAFADCTICPYYPYFPSLSIAFNVSCKAHCCQNIATRPTQACCETMSALSVTYMIAFGLLLGCCTIFAIIGFIISCCKYGKCPIKRRRRPSIASSAQNDETNSPTTQISAIDLPPSYGDVIQKPENRNINKATTTSDIEEKDERSSPPPPYAVNRINVLPVVE